MMETKSLQDDFPILNKTVNGKRLVYLDSAATYQKPCAVIDAMSKYYREMNANIHRSVHKLSEVSTMAYEKAHRVIANFINARSEQEIIFTKNATEALNLVAYSLGSSLKKGDTIVVSRMEHHSNLVPWQQVAKRTGAELKYLPITCEGFLDYDKAESLIDSSVKIVAVAHVSNVLGTINDIRRIVKIAKKYGAFCVVDGAQSVPHIPVDVQDLNCDFLAFSGHKMCGPTGIGVLYGKKELLESMEPFLCGGDMISEVGDNNSSWNDLPWKFEAGTPPIAEGIGLAVAAEYLQNIGMNSVFAHEQEIARYAMAELKNIPGVTIYGPENRIGVISFNVEGIHPHDLGTLLDREGIAIRGGHHCAQPLMRYLGIQSCARISFGIYTTKEDIDAFICALKKAQEVFSR